MTLWPLVQRAVAEALLFSLTHTPGFWRDAFRNGLNDLDGGDLGGGVFVPRIRHNPRNTPCYLAGGSSI